MTTRKTQKALLMPETPAKKLNPQELKIGNIISIIREGTMIGSVSVGLDYDPSSEESESTMEWIGNSEEVTPATEVEEETKSVFDRVSLDWMEVKTATAKSDNLKATLTDYNQLITELQNRTSLVDGEKSVPYATSEVGIKCWMNVKKYAKRKLIADSWNYGILSIDGDIPENNKSGKPKIKFQIIRAPNRSITPSNGYGYAKTTV